MATVRKLGCIPMAEQEMMARTLGVKSDKEKVLELVAPWDATEKPFITDWDSYHKTLEIQASQNDMINDTFGIKPFWEFAKSIGLDVNKLFGVIQKQNDCAAWATVRCYLVRLLNQIQNGTEQTIENINPMALYAYSGDAFKSGERIPNGGRTLGAVALASCDYGLLPSSLCGEYDGKVYVTDGMEKNEKSGLERQAGWVELNFSTIKETIDAVRLCLRANHPILMGNTTALQDGTMRDKNGVCIARVGGSWGGGHATAILHYMKVNDTDYFWVGNSHGLIYPSDDGSPAWGAYITADGLRRYLDGQFRDMFAMTWCESPHGADDFNLNPVPVTR